MAWFWTDDIAHALLAAGVVPESRVQDWMSQPFGVAAAADVDLVALGLSLLGLDVDVEAGAA